ncbi:MAG: BMP family ABC transporter substrate-binding protein [Oscillospiraceae bacterium]|jgi:basic membrane protein A|nr:BMP family ABC transporter substrate-binding protein [Oscillospiraceae bacterium]
MSNGNRKPLVKIATLVLTACAVCVSYLCFFKKDKPKTDTSAIPAGLFVVMLTDVGGIKDNGFNQSAYDEGLKVIESKLGAKVAYLESSQDGDYSGNVGKATDLNPDIIYGIGYKLEAAFDAAAKANRNQQYALIDCGFDPPQPNAVGLKFRDNEAAALAGMLAGLATEEKRVAFVGGMDGVVMKTFEVGFRAGVALAEEERQEQVDVAVRFLGTYTDVSKGKDVGLQLYSDSRDILFFAAGGAGQGVLEAAKERNKYAIGADRDQSDLAPENILGSTLKCVGAAMFQLANEIKEQNPSKRELVGGNRDLGLADGAVGIAFGKAKPVTEEIKAKVKEVEDKIKSGELAIPATEAEFDMWLAARQSAAKTSADDGGVDDFWRPTAATRNKKRVVMAEKPKQTSVTLASVTLAAEDEEATTKAPAQSHQGRATLPVQPAVADEYLILVNAQNPLPDGYTPPALVPLPEEACRGKAQSLAPAAAAAFSGLWQDANKQGVVLKAFSSFRSFERQAELFGAKEEQNKKRGMGAEQAAEAAKKWTAFPGCSEHQGGLAVDVTTSGVDCLSQDFAKTPAYAWLVENGPKYGLVQRYQKDKTHLTGIEWEPWHWRYVGREAAAVMGAFGICLEEFAAALDDYAGARISKSARPRAREIILNCAVDAIRAQGQTLEESLENVCAQGLSFSEWLATLLPAGRQEP